MNSPRTTETETMNQTQDRDSVYNTYDVWKPAPQAAPAPQHRRLSPRAKAGIAVGGVALAATGMVCWSQYETAQANADVKKQQLALEQAQVQLQIQQQAAKASGQETPAQKARREALQACITAAGTSYNGVADCASAYPAIDSTGATLNDAQPTASTTSTSGSTSPVGLIVLGGTGAVVAVGWAKKKLARPY